MSSDYIDFLRKSREMTLTLGEEFSYEYGNDSQVTLRVIKTTPKGINLLVLETDCVLLKRRHLYDRKWAGKNVPRGTRTFTVRVLDHIAERLVPLKPAKEA